jgi:hypothetical protein
VRSAPETPRIDRVECFAIQNPICGIQQMRSWGLRPDFLWGLLALMNFMRLSLMKAAHADLIGTACRKSGRPIVFGPGTPRRTWPTRLSFELCYDTDSERDGRGRYPSAEFLVSLGQAWRTGSETLRAIIPLKPKRRLEWGTQHLLPVVAKTIPRRLLRP